MARPDDRGVAARRFACGRRGERRRTVGVGGRHRAGGLGAEQDGPRVIARPGLASPLHGVNHGGAARDLHPEAGGDPPPPALRMANALTKQSPVSMAVPRIENGRLVLESGGLVMRRRSPVGRAALALALAIIGNHGRSDLGTVRAHGLGQLLQCFSHIVRPHWASYTGEIALDSVTQSLASPYNCLHPSVTRILTRVFQQGLYVSPLLPKGLCSASHGSIPHLQRATRG
ncbi:hypothetical protein SAMN04489708_12426 [Paracidovorax cattleyae]|uniref:Uncharacterized protein n=1 Tax=Paracidovorax cattleyae TaxID=80868 RepID=A0A1H0V924_9BURK|nr:hypothetical protein SAMN04489708_12426 [Paracidovorax cattleyae]